MGKYVKAVIYGEPGVGKSTFAFKAPKPFFITTDGNYEYLVDYFDADEAAHKEVFSWEQAKKVFSSNFEDYETIVVDLLEDLYMWSDKEFCKSQNIAHIADLGYGKGYSMVGDEFFIEISKLLSLNKNVILIMHGVEQTLKDRRGIEYTKYAPSTLLREKICTQIEGRVRFFLRAFAETSEDEGGNLVTKRYLSLSPDGKTEYGIARGLVGAVPRVIPLDWDVFYEIATRKPEGLGTVSSTKIVESADMPVKKSPAKPVVKKTTGKSEVQEVEIPTKKEENVMVLDATEHDNSNDDLLKKLAETMNNVGKFDSIQTKTVEPKSVPQELAKEVEHRGPVKVSQSQIEPSTSDEAETPKQLSKADQIAAIKAKMAAMRK